MITELQLQDFRGFSCFKLKDLARVNLLVGANNSGKTSLLEAIELLVARGDSLTLLKALTRRGERIIGESPHKRNEFDVSHLFHGHEPKVGSSFKVLCRNGADIEGITAHLEEAPSEKSGKEIIADDSAASFRLSLRSLQLGLVWNASAHSAEATSIPLTEILGALFNAVRRYVAGPPTSRTPFTFVTTKSLSEEEVIAGVGSIVLDPEEEFVIEALRIIEPSIERIAPVAGDVVLRSSNSKRRIPIGTMGDGIWHLLSLALSLVRARGGVLLVDEIDTGLHYSVMEDMWRLVQRTAERLDVQVFATTHSNDCWKALAAVCSNENGSGGKVSMQRIERDKTEGVPFSEREIVIAAESGIEVR